MYSSVLALHSLLRWVVLVAGLIAIARAISGWAGHRPWTPADARSGRWFTVALDVQLLLGLLLYFVLSPLTRQALADFGAAMRTPAIRYWAMDHAMGMLIAVICAHVGLVLARKGQITRSSHRRAAIWFGISLLLIIALIPWPGTAHARALWPF